MIYSDLKNSLLPVVKAFESLNIPYFIGGSVASSNFGIARATMDVDLIADFSNQHIEPLSQLLAQEYYLDKSQILQAIQRRASFNLIHLATAFKVDIFLLKTRTFDQTSMKRRQLRNLAPNDEMLFYFSAMEDLILNKLEWFKLGGEVSEKQWRDIQGILQLQRDHIDHTYLDFYAKELNLTALLQKALK